jgi:hypothetical protein
MVSCVTLGASMPTIGLFLDPLATEFRWTSTEASQIATAFMLCFQISGPAVGWLIERGTVKFVMAAGVALVVLGYSWASVAQTLPQITAAMAVLGLGASASTYIPCTVLVRARSVARSKFNGPITYGSGSWESIDWSGFDFVTVDHYRNADNAATYSRDLRAYRRYGKPIIVGEFGCCTYEGAEKAGGMGWDIVDAIRSSPRLRGSYTRSEKVQADYIGVLLEIFALEAIEGAFVYQFIDARLPHSTDPRYDLDVASYGVVKVRTAESAESDALVWEPKLAFHEIGKRYGAT